VMSRRAGEQGAVNVGQGFPDFPSTTTGRASATGCGPSTSTRPCRAARCAPQLPPRSGPEVAKSIRKPSSRSPAGHRIYLFRHPGGGGCG
jgi:hypothetical protein